MDDGDQKEIYKEFWTCMLGWQEVFIVQTLRHEVASEQWEENRLHSINFLYDECLTKPHSQLQRSAEVTVL